jgi:hypothetical protein
MRIEVVGADANVLLISDIAARFSHCRELGLGRLSATRALR